MIMSGNINIKFCYKMKYKYLLILLTAFSTFNVANELDPLEILKEYVSIDTVNPPGNESNAVEFL